MSVAAVRGAVILLTVALSAAPEARACIVEHYLNQFGLKQLPSEPPPAEAVVLRVRIERALWPAQRPGRAHPGRPCDGCDLVGRVLEVKQGVWPERRVRISRDQGIMTSCDVDPPVEGDEVFVVGLAREEAGKGVVLAAYSYSVSSARWSPPDPLGTVIQLKDDE